MPDIKPKSKGGVKLAAGVLALVAVGVRLGIKKGAGVEYGTPQKNFFEDLKNTISESLKNIKISVGGGHGQDKGTPDVKSVGH